MAWKNLRIRADLHRLVATRAESEQRSVAQMADRLLMRALEQETTVEVPQRTADRVTSGRSSPARAPAEEAGEGTGAWTASLSSSPPGSIDGQTTIDEMLAACPNCAGELATVDTAEGPRGACVECGYVREPDA